MPDNDVNPPQPPTGTTPESSSGDDRDGASGLMRFAALAAAVAVVTATVLIVVMGGEEQKPQSIVPVDPVPKSLADAGYTEQSDGRFDPEGFGMSFDYPEGFFEMLSPAGETSRDDDTIGVSERRRHFLFPDSANDATDARDAQPAFRIIRVTYEDGFGLSRLEEFRSGLADQPGVKPTKIAELGGVPSFSRAYEVPGGHGSGETTYFATKDTLYQLISFATEGDEQSVEQAQDEILASVVISE